MGSAAPRPGIARTGRRPRVCSRSRVRGGRTIRQSGHVRTTSARRCFDALPSEELGVHRPPTRSQHRESAADGSCHETDQRVLGHGQHLQDLDRGNGRPGQGRPEPRDEKKPRTRQGCGGERGLQRRRAPDLRAGADKDDRADDQAQEQQPCTRPTARETWNRGAAFVPVTARTVWALRVQSDSPDRVQLVTLSSRRRRVCARTRLVASKAG